MARRMMLTPGESGEYKTEEINDNGRFVESHREERPSHWVDEDTGKIMDRKDMGWDELADQQRANRETEAINENRKTFDQYLAIEQGAKRQKSELNHQRAIAFTAAAHSARENGGMSDSSLSASLSQAFGRPTYGIQLVKGIDIGNGPESVYVMYGPGKDPQTGKTTIRPTGMIGSRDAVKLFDSAGLGDDTNDLRNDIIDNSYLGKLTDDQRAAMGVSRPSAPISTGTTVISAAGMRALRGTPRTPSRVSWFGSDGKGGFSRGAVDRKTGEDWNEDTGTRSPDYQGRWRVLESNADGMRYENDQTGEVVNVPKGSSLRDVLRGSSERERVAQIQAQGRADAAQTQANNKLAIAKLNADQRREAAELAAKMKQLGIEVGIDLSEAKAADSTANTMERATTGVTNQPKHSEENIEAQRKKGEEARNRARQRASGNQPAATTQQNQGSQAQASSGDNTKSGAIQEFNPKGKYRAGDKFSRNGVVYEVGSDGQPHRVK